MKLRRFKEAGRGRAGRRKPRHATARGDSPISDNMKPTASNGNELRYLRRIKGNSSKYLLQLARTALVILIGLALSCELVVKPTWAQAQATSKHLPDLAGSTSDEPIVAVVGQDAFLSCVAKNLQNYTILWRYSNEASAPGDGGSDDTARRQVITPATTTTTSSPSTSPSSEGTITASRFNQEEYLGAILTAGRQRVTSDERISIIQSHDTWLLKISNVRLADTGTYICHTNSWPRVRVARILSVIKPSGAQSQQATDGSGAKQSPFDEIDYNFTDCCRAEYVAPRCQRLCNFQQLTSTYQSISILHDCYSSLPSITRCMVAGRNVTDCCTKRHIPTKCNSMCGHQGDTSAMSIQDQNFCADYSASIMSCVAEGVTTMPGQPELVIVEAVSSTTLKVSWQKVADESEQRKIDGWIINLTKLSSFEDTISAPADARATNPRSSSSLQQTNSRNNNNSSVSVSSSFSSTTTSSDSRGKSSNANPLSGLTIVDVSNSASLTSMTNLLAASSGTISLKVDKQSNEYSIENLKPYTVYQIQMFAFNSQGRSQLTDPIRALTLAPEFELSSANDTSAEAYVEPSLPDTRKCCLDRGVTLKRCLDTLCDPVEADRATIADMMICAPWSNITFSCLSSRVNHTDCCKSRGVTPFCLPMCSGDIKRVDYRHFRCLTHMSTYTNCILESHNVLPSPPQNFTVGPITHSWAVLNWRPSKIHARSLQGYRIFWRRVDPATSAGSYATNSSLARPIDGASQSMGDSGSAMTSDEFYYSSAEAATNPYLLDALQPSTVYETFAVAVNKFGQSESSSRFIFQTLADPEVLAAKQSGVSQDGLESRLPLHGNTTQDQFQTYYNETACCVSGGVYKHCQDLCTYDIRVTDVSSLMTTCNSQLPVILRCMAGSRNSVPCCRNRGVSDQCLNTCAGLTVHSPLGVAARCSADFGKIIRCMDEGSKQIPGAPVDLHTRDIKSDRVTIEWAPASEDKLRTDIEYHIRYQRLQQSPEQSATNDPSSLIAVVPLHPLEHNLIRTTNKTQAELDKLAPNARYSIYVTAENSYGISLPSLVLVIQTPDESTAETDTSNYHRRATLGAPHSLEVLRSDTESVFLKWAIPLFINNEVRLRYRVFYKFLGAQNASSDAVNASQSSTGGGDTTGGAQQVSGNWTILETAETNVLLRNLRYSSQYAITVQAFNATSDSKQQMLGHMSEILLASTARPVPPTLNHPLVINNPVEGKNITIMCVALGQPTPQISMFINGLLVQKRTQPYVIYHLVNLVRGQLTITCFASNGYGRDYASVQSRTEVSVKFPSKATAKFKDISSPSSSTARMTCEISGNPQPTVVWTFAAAAGQPAAASGEAGSQPAGAASVIQASDRVTTLLVSQFENPFTWTHTLTLRNISSSDAGRYQCRARNSLTESSDTIQLTVAQEHQSDSAASSSSSSGASSEPPNSPLRVEERSNLMDCCRSQNVSAKCLPVCSVDGLDVETAFKTPECQSHLDKLMFCAADGSDHRHCCRTRQVPSSCLRWCSGAKFNIPALCFLSSAIDINQCFQEGRTFLPGPPRNIRIMLASDSDHGEREVEAPQVATMTTSGQMGMFSGPPSPATSTPTTSDTSNSNSNNSSVISTIANGDGSQHAPSEEPAGAQEASSEPLVLEWDPPLKNPKLVEYYRIFWRPIGSRELSRTVTNLTWIKLTDLSMNKQYEFVVKAANNLGSSVYSDPLTVKPSEILSRSDLASVGMIWFMPSSGTTHLLGRVFGAVCFATMFMFGSLALVVLLEKRGYLKGFASSKTNSSRVSFVNPAYLKDSDNTQDGDTIAWENGHSLDVLGLPPQSSQTSSGATD